MRYSRATHERRPSIRRMHWNDVPEILGIAGRTPASPWIRPDFLSVFQSNETVGYVAVGLNRIAGFALCSITYPHRGFGAGPTFLTKLFGWMSGAGHRRRPHLNLFGLGLAPDGRRSEVERYLLDAVVREFEESAEMIQVVVPERSLSAQKLLRNAGFQAIRVFRAYYGREDGYLMRQDGARLPPKIRPKHDVSSASHSADGTRVRHGQ